MTKPAHRGRWIREYLVLRYLASRHLPLPARGPFRSLVDSRQVLQELFDGEGYLKRYPDALGSRSPLFHYCRHGWHEGRDPSIGFSTDLYLRQNPDVAGTGINPLYHYAMWGLAEGRPPLRQPPGSVASIVPHLETPTPDHRISRVSAASRMETARRLKKAVAVSSPGIALSISHDVYVRSTGGVQLAVGIEEHEFRESGFTYVHLSPAIPQMLLDPQTTTDAEVHVTVNGDPLGETSIGDAINSLDGVGTNGDLQLIIHSLIGHSPEALGKLVASIRPREAWYWLHDYSYLCSSFHLLRNDRAWCGAPDQGSNSCTVCRHGEIRSETVRRINELLDAWPISIVAPSAVAEQMFHSRSMMGSKHVRVHPIAILTPIEPARVRSSTADHLNVAFVGATSIPKGWPTFASIVEKYARAKAFNFHYFGVVAPGIDGLKAHFVRVDREDPLAMMHALAEADIDIVVMPSVTKETFSIVAHEALASGAQVLTLESSGNINALVRSTGEGLVFDDPSSLIAAFSDIRSLLRLRSAGSRYSLRHTRMTVDLISPLAR